MVMGDAMNAVEKLIAQHRREQALTFDPHIRKLSEAGVRVMLTKLLGLADDAIDKWATMGPLIEAHRIDVSFSEEERQWEATCHGDIIEVDIQGPNPRLAVGRLLVARQIDSDLGNSYSLRMPYRVALDFGHEHQPDEDGVVPGPEEQVTLKLRIEDY